LRIPSTARHDAALISPRTASATGGASSLTGTRAADPAQCARLHGA